MNEDFRDFLRALLGAGARFLVVGAHALAVHGVPRATGDLDVWIETSAENVEQVWAGVLAFGAPVESLGVTRDDLRKHNVVVQIGTPPRRIDVLTSITGVKFDEAWLERTTHAVDDAVVVSVLGCWGDAVFSGVNQDRLLAQPSVTSPERGCDTLEPALQRSATLDKPPHQCGLQPVVGSHSRGRLGHVRIAENAHQATRTIIDSVRAISA